MHFLIVVITVMSSIGAQSRIVQDAGFKNATKIILPPSGLTATIRPAVKVGTFDTATVKKPDPMAWTRILMFHSAGFENLLPPLRPQPKLYLPPLPDWALRQK